MKSYHQVTRMLPCCQQHKFSVTQQIAAGMLGDSASARQSPSNLTCHWCQLLASLRIQVCSKEGITPTKDGIGTLNPRDGIWILKVYMSFGGNHLDRIEIKKPEHTKKITNFEVSFGHLWFQGFSPTELHFFRGSIAFPSVNLRDLTCWVSGNPVKR